MKTYLLLVVVVLFSSGPAWAAVTRLETVFIDGVPSNTYTHDLLIDFNGQLGGQQLLIELDQGSIYYGVSTDGITPLPSWPGLLPPFEDPYATTVTPIGEVLVFGGASTLGGSVPLVSTSDAFSIAWAPSVGVVVADQERYQAARVTLSRDARGTLKYLSGTLDGGDPLLAELPISFGSVGGSFDAVRGDFNNDGRVDNGDLNLLLENWGADSVPIEWANGFEGIVDYVEWNDVLAGWGSGLAIPEPTSFSLFSSLGLLLSPYATRRGGRS